MPLATLPRLRPMLRKPPRRAVRRNVVSLLIMLLVTGLGILVQGTLSTALYEGSALGGVTAPLSSMETAAQDYVLRLRTPDMYTEGQATLDPRQVITLVTIDDASLKELGIWSAWPRTYYARLVDELMQAQPAPRVIAFDIGFFDPSPDVPELAAAFDRARASRLTSIITPNIGGGNAQRGPRGDVQFSRGLDPVPELAARADLAFANVVPDSQGSVHAMPLLATIDGVQEPTLGLAATAKFLRRPKPFDDRPDPTTIVLAGRTIPVDADSMLKINYFGPPSKFHPESPTFKSVPFSDVMLGRANPDTWKGGIVFVGFTATGFADDYWTPFSVAGEKMPGVEIHANVAATLFTTQFLRDAPVALDLAAVVALALLLGLLSANLGVVPASISALLILVGYTIGNAQVLYRQGLQMALVTPLLSGLLSYVAVTAYRVAIEQRQARALQGALASVIPPAVALEIARDPDRVRMGGERRVISVLFTDLKGFTTFSESVSPEVLSRVITQYLDAMTAVIFRYGGTVDKFIGDAVMAFWNAPLNDPGHARHACLAALEMQSALRRLGDEWEAEGLPRQYMRVGINTGPVSVGNMGTSQRFAYTALGDTVNLGARLEPLNNEYGTWICLSQATLDAAGGQGAFLVRFLDLVAVKGKKEPVPVYELIGLTHDQSLAQRYAPILEPYHRGMVLYQAQQFEPAREQFLAALRAGEEVVDQPSAVYAERCLEMAEAPPEPDWDGVYVMHHK